MTSKPKAYSPVPNTHINPAIDEALDKVIDHAITGHDPTHRLVEIGAVPVDAGTICIVDPCYLIPGNDHHPLTQSAWKSVCDRFSQLWKDRKPEAIARPFAGDYGTGLLVSGFGGDGVYPVFAIMHGNTIARIIIDIDGTITEQFGKQNGGNAA